MGEKIITWEEYEKHIYSYDCWVMIDQMVYNVNDYLVEHPGGDDILVRYHLIEFLGLVEEMEHSRSTMFLILTMLSV